MTSEAFQALSVPSPHLPQQWPMVQGCLRQCGNIHSFGVREDPQGPSDNYLRAVADLNAGRQPFPTTISPGEVTVKGVCNHYRSILMPAALNVALKSCRACQSPSSRQPRKPAETLASSEATHRFLSLLQAASLSLILALASISEELTFLRR